MVSVNFISSIKNSCQSVYNKIPSKVVQKDNILNGISYIGKKISSPQQRLIMGATAIVMQPVIDYSNRHVDDNTRKVSVARTCAKVIAGTATGFALRYAFIKGIKAFSHPLSEVPLDVKPWKKKMMTWLTPTNVDYSDPDQIQHYRNAMGTIWSLVAMVFTNFLLDAPLTKFLTNKFLGIKKKAEEKSTQKAPIDNVEENQLKENKAQAEQSTTVNDKPEANKDIEKGDSK